jgi:hypothetical protein
MNSPLFLLRLVQALAPPSFVLQLGAFLLRALARIVAPRFVDRHPLSPLAAAGRKALNRADGSGEGAIGQRWPR